MAALLTTISFLPQVIKTIATKDTSGVSFWIYLIFVSGVAMWLLYGILIKNPIIIIANLITFILAGTILVIKIHNIVKR
ncbi:MAG: SemiSWEET transporter [Rickettsiales bacterium]|nr:SemiSWEET transporter [Rickettsiales bacterium]